MCKFEVPDLKPQTSFIIHNCLFFSRQWNDDLVVESKGRGSVFTDVYMHFIDNKIM